MPIRDMQARLREAGRIRIGTSKPHGKGKVPVRLDTFRLTSKDETLIRAVAELYGGEPQPWNDQWEVITQADELRVVLIPVPGGSISQWYEYWSQPNGQGAVSCLRRCDGFEQVDGTPCQCPADPEVRDKDKDACSRYTRLSVLLPDVPTMGSWRLETQGYYAGVELAAAVALIDHALAASGLMVAARLRLEQRKVPRDGSTLTFPVPALDLVDRLDRVAALASSTAPLALPATTLARPDGPSLAEGVAAADAQKDRVRSGRQAAPLGPPAPAPTSQPLGPSEPEDGVAPLEFELRRLAKMLGTEDKVEDAIRDSRGSKQLANHADWLSRQIKNATAKAAAIGHPSEQFPIPEGALDK